MKSGISFKELAKLNREILAKQPPVTLEQLQVQGQWLKKVSKSNNKKENPNKLQP